MTEGQGHLAGVPPAGEKKTRAERTRIRDAELKAIERIMRILGALPQELGDVDADERVVRYLAERYGFILAREDR